MNFDLPFSLGRPRSPSEKTPFLLPPLSPLNDCGYNQVGALPSRQGPSYLPNDSSSSSSVYCQKPRYDTERTFFEKMTPNYYPTVVPPSVSDRKAPPPSSFFEPHSPPLQSAYDRPRSPTSSSSSSSAPPSPTSSSSSSSFSSFSSQTRYPHESSSSSSTPTHSTTHSTTTTTSSSHSSRIASSSSAFKPTTPPPSSSSTVSNTSSSTSCGVQIEPQIKGITPRVALPSHSHPVIGGSSSSSQGASLVFDASLMGVPAKGVSFSRPNSSETEMKVQVFHKSRNDDRRLFWQEILSNQYIRFSSSGKCLLLNVQLPASFHPRSTLIELFALEKSNIISSGVYPQITKVASTVPDRGIPKLLVSAFQKADSSHPANQSSESKWSFIIKAPDVRPGPHFFCVHVESPQNERATGFSVSFHTHNNGHVTLDGKRKRPNDSPKNQSNSSSSSSSSSPSSSSSSPSQSPSPSPSPVQSPSSPQQDDHSDSALASLTSLASALATLASSAPASQKEQSYLDEASRLKKQRT